MKTIRKQLSIKLKVTNEGHISVTYISFMYSSDK